MKGALLGGAMTYMIEQSTLILKNQVSELSRVFDLVASFCARHSISAEMEYDLNLALDEIVTNVIKYGYPEGGQHEFSVQIAMENGEFVARVEDDGREFDPTAHPSPNFDAPLEKRKEGGLGIFLVRQIMTSFEYQRVNGRNLITVRKKVA